MVNLSGTERWRELCRLLGVDDGGLDYATPEGLARLADREWNRAKLAEFIRGLRVARRPTSGRRRCSSSPPPVAKCNTLAEWLASEQARVDELVVDVDDPVLGRVPLVGPPVRIGVGSGGTAAPAAATAASRARSVGTASWTCRTSGRVRWRRACWPSSGPRW